MIVAQGSHQRQVHILSPYDVLQLRQIDLSRRMIFLTAFAVMTRRPVVISVFSRMSVGVQVRVFDFRRRKTLGRGGRWIRERAVRIVQGGGQLSFQLHLLLPQLAPRILYHLLLESSIIIVLQAPPYLISFGRFVHAVNTRHGLTASVDVVRIVSIVQ